MRRLALECKRFRVVMQLQEMTEWGDGGTITTVLPPLLLAFGDGILFFFFFFGVLPLPVLTVSVVASLLSGDGRTVVACTAPAPVPASAVDLVSPSNPGMLGVAATA